MAKLNSNPIRFSCLTLGVALALAPSAQAADVSVRLDAGSGFVVENSSGATELLRVDEATGNLSRNGALFVHTTGTNNLFVGAGAGNPTTTGEGGNTALGYGALYANTTGFSNSALGNRTLISNTTGAHNSALGSYALYLNTTGSRNLAIGPYAGRHQTTGSDNIYLANVGVAAESGRIRIGTTPTHTATFVAGIHGANLGGNGVPVYVTPSGQLGTGGGTQPPWTGDIDAANFDLTGLRELIFGSNDETDGGFDIEFPAQSGFGFRIGSAEGKLSDGTGIARDTIAAIGFNWNDGGVNHGTPFNPSWGLSFESNFPTGGWPTDTVQEHHWISQVGRTTGTVANGTGFAADQVVVVEEPGNGATVGIGVLKSIGAGAGATAVIDWIYSENADTNPPSNGDIIERESSTTVVGRSGNFAFSGGGLWVYPSAVCGEDETTATAILGLSSVANQVGTTADLVFVRSFGPGTDVVAGNCVRQAATNATALLGPISIPATTTLTSSPTSTNDGAWRPMSTIFSPHLQAMVSSWYSNRTLQATGVPTMRIGTTDPGQTSHWFTIASRLTGPGGNDYVGAIGDEVEDQNYAIWGRWWIFEPGGFDHVSLGAASISGTKTQDLANENGTIAVFTDLTGCADDVPVVASGSAGGIKCGSASLMSSLTSAAPPSQGGGGVSADFGLVAVEVAKVYPELVIYDEEGEPSSVKYDEMASMLWNELKEQRDTIEGQARAIQALRREHEREVAALAKRLARIETRVIGVPDGAVR